MKTKNLLLMIFALSTISTAKAGPQLYTVVCQEPTSGFNLTLNLITPNRRSEDNGDGKEASILESLELKKVSPKHDVPVEVFQIVSKHADVTGAMLTLNLIFNPAAPKISETHSLNVSFDLTRLDIKNARYTLRTQIDLTHSVQSVNTLSFGQCVIR